MIPLEDIISQWEKDSIIDSVALEETTMKFARIHAKYLQLLSEARLTVKKLKSEFEKTKLEKWRYFSGKMTQVEMDGRGWPYDPFDGATKPLRSDLDRYIDTDADIVKAKHRIDYNEEIVEACTEIINTLRWRHSHVKNIIDFRKFTSGC